MGTVTDPPSHSVTEGGAAVTHPVLEGDDALVAPNSGDEINTIKAALLPVACWRVEDIRFAFDSSFVTPELKAEMPILAGLREQHKIGDLRPPLSLFGHADPVGNDDYNKLLSGRRAMAIFGLLIRSTDIWEDLFSNTGKTATASPEDKWGTGAIQTMLDTVGSPPGRTDGVMDQPTRDAIKDFQGKNGLDPSGQADKPTRAALFLAYMDALCGPKFKLDKTEDFLARGADPHGKGDVQGCGEFNPLLLFSQAEENTFASAGNQTNRNTENAPNRRVMVFLFRPGTKITAAKWPCPLVKEGTTGCRKRFWSDGEARRSRHLPDARRKFEDTKDTFACRFYHRLATNSPCENPGWLGLVRPFRIFLKLMWLDPVGKPRVFPSTFPVTVVFDDNSTLNAAVSDDGLLEFVTDHKHKSFTLRFASSSESFIVSAPDGTAGSTPPPGSSGAPPGGAPGGTAPAGGSGATGAPAGAGTEKLAFAPEIKGLIEGGNRVWSLPLQWSVADSEWKAPDAKNFDGKAFTQMDQPETRVGAAGSPVGMTLDPHWQFMQFLYFDRSLKKKMSLPPVMVQGERKVVPRAAGEAPDTRSNWTTGADPDLRQCLPWVIRKDAAGKDAPKPDKASVLSLRSLPGTFVEAKSDGTRRVITTVAATPSGGTPPPDPAQASIRNPGLNTGAADTTDLNVPNVDRLRFYDIPAEWMSRVYFARLSGGAGAPPAKQDLFNNLAADPTSNDKPVQFSLDDIVLTDNKLNPITAQTTDRLTVFSHLFAADSANSKVGPTGLFDADANEPYFSKTTVRLTLPGSVSSQVYVSDYPDWTRLVIAQGNLFDAFDQRTTVASVIVGARAGVRWVDATQSPNYAAVGSSMSPRPKFTRQPFFALQPMFEQDYVGTVPLLSPGTYDFVTNPDIPSGNRASLRPIGRYDQAVLRCCDVNGSDEIGVALEYFRFSFNFTRAPANEVAKWQNLNTDAGKQQQFKNITVANIPTRWNGPDGTLNPGRAVIASKSSSPGLKVPVLWFAQVLPKAVAHFDLEVVPNKGGRSFMQGFDGTAELRVSANEDEGAGKLVAAHECGHANSLPDEYVESGTLCSYNQAPVSSKDIITDFYSLDQNPMMTFNRQIRGRYYWHIAEWLRAVYGGAFKITHDSLDYEVFLHPNNDPKNPKTMRTFTYWPMKADIDTRASGQKFDVFFYALGADKFTTQLIKPGTTIKGAVVVMVKMKFSFPATPAHVPLGTFGRIRDDLATLDRRLNTRFNNRFKVSGTVAGQNFTDCVVQFAFRYLVQTITNESVKENQDYIKDNSAGGNSVSAYNSQVSQLQSNHGIHIAVNVTDSPTAPASGLSGTTLHLRSDQFNQFDTLVGQYLGISMATPTGGGTAPDQNQILPLVGKVMTGTAIGPL